MKFPSIAVALALLIADFSVARSSRLEERIASRARSTRLIVAADSNRVIQAGAALSTNNSNTESSTNWVGVVLTSPPPGQTFNTGAAAVWVGIDGDTAPNSILQAGVDLIVSSNGSVSYQAWFEWFPNFAMDFSNFPISAGDFISIIVQSTNATNGQVILFNESNGMVLSQLVNAPSSTTALAGQNAERIVERGSVTPLTNFTSITFLDASATASSSIHGLINGTIIELRQNSSIITNVTINDSVTFTITFL